MDVVYTLACRFWFCYENSGITKQLNLLKKKLEEIQWENAVPLAGYTFTNTEKMSWVKDMLPWHLNYEENVYKHKLWKRNMWESRIIYQVPLTHTPKSSNDINKVGPTKVIELATETLSKKSISALRMLVYKVQRVLAPLSISIRILFRVVYIFVLTFWWCRKTIS